jgi:hypothetical protein
MKFETTLTGEDILELINSVVESNCGGDGCFSRMKVLSFNEKTCDLRVELE